MGAYGCGRKQNYRKSEGEFDATNCCPTRLHDASFVERRDGPTEREPFKSASPLTVVDRIRLLDAGEMGWI
jgi:hypothetical protein